MMLTKEQCEKALKNIALSYDAEYVNECNDEFCQAMKNYIKMLENLIEEHFEDKKTLKERFKGYEGETPKEDPWGDRYADECSKEEINKWILEGYGMPPVREKDDVD